MGTDMRLFVNTAEMRQSLEKWISPCLWGDGRIRRKSERKKRTSTVFGEFCDKNGDPIPLENLQEDSVRYFHDSCIQKSLRAGEVYLAHRNGEWNSVQSNHAEEVNATINVDELSEEQDLAASSSNSIVASAQLDHDSITAATLAKSKSALFWRLQPSGPMRTTSRYASLLLPCMS